MWGLHPLKNPALLSVADIASGITITSGQHLVVFFDWMLPLFRSLFSSPEATFKQTWSFSATGPGYQTTSIARPFLTMKVLPIQ